MDNIKKFEFINKKSNLELIIISDKQYDINETIFVAEGNVEAKLKNATLKANRIQYDRLNKKIIACNKCTR